MYLYLEKFGIGFQAEVIGQSNKDLKRKKLGESWSLFYHLHYTVLYIILILQPRTAPVLAPILKKWRPKLDFSKYISRLIFILEKRF